ncbi:MAG: ATP-dependent zinc metalloprotease FtsH [Zhenhengia yiwuensis]|nr:ATP-dependent zinc metalloprotease FtsH [Zhenhengia yiwuensis]MDU6358351.1 ATP-dependent zinc metalloprotease FtsH [Clostridiales bacterium]MDU6854212.1 ATP-dependent zinc metalloprotease FtsH [Clostridiales bacterium]MDU6973945.1 ATP-dependent zinc metalloprotease FtsH [Clostridiales bacterium]MDY3366568.1 ATP-dependent zinc metalloprotease FtsH [Zhenhengia yiwuensis]
MKGKMKGSMLYLIIVGILLVAILFGANQNFVSQKQQLNLGDFITNLSSGNIAKMDVELASDGSTAYVSFKLKDQGNYVASEGIVPMDQSAFFDYVLKEVPPELMATWEFDGYVQQPSLFFPILQIVLIVGMFIFIMVFFMQQMQGGGGGGGRGVMSFGKSKAKMTVDDKGSTTFKDVAGLDEEKEEVAELVDFLKNPRKYTEIGAKIPKGILLVGPPGTGKTLLAKAVAGEAQVPFFSISGSDFVEMFVGVGASRVRDLFEQAKKNAPAIVFIDEIDAVGRKRGAGLGGGHDEREQTLNQLLVEMDGFGINEGVIVVAATNRADILDPALLRPGRFDRQVVVGRPDVKGRESILKVHAKGKPLNEDVDLKVIARTTPGFTGADLANLMNEAALLTARHNKRAIDMEEVQKAFIKITVGTEKKSHLVTDKEKRITAFHEVGHALIHELLETLDPVHSVSIIPTGFAGGYTMPLPKEDKLYMTKTRMLDEIVSLLGGRAAEELVFGDITTGASNDIERATNIARDMVTKYGMSELGPIKFGDEQEEVFLGRDFSHQRNYSEDVATAIDHHIRSIVEDAYDRSKQLLTDNMDTLNRASEVLLTKEKITGHEFRKIMRGEDVDMEVLDEQSIFEMAKQMEQADQEEAEREL